MSDKPTNCEHGNHYVCKECGVVQDYELKLCPVHGTMTNHLNDVCQKGDCKYEKEPVVTPYVEQMIVNSQPANQTISEILDNIEPASMKYGSMSEALNKAEAAITAHYNQKFLACLPEKIESVSDDNEITPTLPDFYNAAIDQTLANWKGKADV